MFQHVLIPIDGSRHALAALQHARQAIDPAGKVTLVAVVDSEELFRAQVSPAGVPYFGRAFAASLVREAVQSEREAAEEHLAEARGVLEYGGVRNVDARIVEGLPGEAIVAVARAEDCDLVVMATHGRSGVVRAVFGSVADYVVRHIQGVPVMLVRASAEDEARREPASTAPGSTERSPA